MNLFKKILLSQEEVLGIISDSLSRNSPLLLTYFNQHCFNIYFRDNNYRKILDDKFVVYPDGIGVFAFLKYKLKKNNSRIDATSLNEVIIEKFIKGNENILFVGGMFDEELLRKKMQERNINLTGYQHGFFKEEEKKEIIKKIILNNARIVIIGMGVPKQEFFAEEIVRSSNNKIVICIGNYFEFYFGKVKRAPVISQKLGLEWLYRLITEPKRLWKRYLFGIPEFIYRVIRIKLR